MKFDYDYKITFTLNEPFDVNYVNNFCMRNSDKKILVEVQNTKGITATQLRKLNSNVGFRIVGGYDEEKVKRKGKLKGNNGETGKYYTEAVIYTRNEAIKILEEIEKIESNLNPNWSSIQKLLYIYDRLKTGIMYDPKFEHKLSSEIRSLRGLITKQTVCAGYALILKEFMDRNNITCEYVEGHIEIDEKGKRKGGHAWNIITIAGKKYPIDLTWDNSKFRTGKFDTFDFLGQDIEKFCKNHHPDPEEKTQNYKQTLSQIDPKIIEQIYSQIAPNRARDYSTTTYYGDRKDGSKYIIAQVGYAEVNNKTYYRYYYIGISNDGKRKLPIILYSENNLTKFINYKNFGMPKLSNCKTQDEYNQKLKEYHQNVLNVDYIYDNVLFSKENIKDSLDKGTYYLGSFEKNNLENTKTLSKFEKPVEKRNLFVFPTKVFTRSDGSVFIAQKMYKEQKKANGIDIIRYDIFEIVAENGKEVLKRNTVFTERDFFKDNRQSMVDDYLSRSRLDRKAKETGSYIGYYSSSGNRTYNPELNKFFSTAKRIDIDLLSKQIETSNATRVQVPSFSELKSLASKYEIFLDSKDPFDPDTSKIKIRNIKTGQIQTDKSIIDRAMFANIWLNSAGVKYYGNETRLGETYAFNELAEELYNVICKELVKSCKNKGVIDTVELFKNIDNINGYKYRDSIIVRLFRTPYQTQLINKLFLQSLGINQQTKIPEPLYNIGYAGDIAFNSKKIR